MKNYTIALNNYIKACRNKDIPYNGAKANLEEEFNKLTPDEKIKAESLKLILHNYYQL